ncbi:MAG: hypothetical protein AB7Q42_18585 [Acidimicrobiia bacterium]
MKAPLARPDDGFTLVMAVLITAIVFSLGATWLSYADHQNSASAYDRRRQQAIDAANAGLVVADAALARNSAYAGTAATDFAGGSAQFELSVSVDPTDPTGFRRIITSTGFAPAKSEPGTGRRTMRQVVELEPLGFQYAMFSESAIITGSSAGVVGDMYANGSITLGNSQDYVGHIYTQGNVTTGSNQQITGDIYAAGTISVTSSSTTLAGSAYAGVDIVTGGTVRNNAQAGGTIGCTKVQGSCSPGSPPAGLPVQHLPTFTWEPSNYSSVTTYADGAAFVSAVSKHDTSGAFQVTGDVAFANNDSLYLVGDMTIVATGNIALPRQVENRAAGGAPVQLTIVSSGGGNITPFNNFTIPSTVTTLMFTEGNFDAKNSSTFTGALYAGSLTNGARLTVTYAPLDDIGFDWTDANPQAFDVRNVSTREITYEA